MAHPSAKAYYVCMSGPSNRPKHEVPKAPVFGPHPDDAADVLEGIEAAERGEALSAEESAAYVQSLSADDPQHAAK
jgi:hypothetical protein